MDSIEYIGELLWPRNSGYFLVLLAFFSAIFSSYSLFQANKTKNTGWKNIGNSFFVIHGISVLLIMGLIFYLMINQRYEYSYVQAHVSSDLPFKYIFSAFWEGQEGSFLLWSFWHVILGWVLMFTNRKWAVPVIAFLSIIEAFIMSMLLGVHIEIGDFVYKFGSNPFTLLRDTMDIPLFRNAEYLTLLKGTGLNPLLQNYWMSIHPPTLFLGFSSVSIPFCFAAAALLNRQHTQWLKVVLPWSFFSASIFGIGILMGAAWAYEALTFGGYWTWDPVENSSFVPWLTLVAGIHANLVASNTRHSIKTTYWMYLISFILIIYSTTLTRSGVLGETSVHAFTEMGLEFQLFTFLGFFILLSIILYSLKQKDIPSHKQEETVSSKEFWMFIGALVLLFSSIMITFSTSLPVFNKIIQIYNPEFVSMVIKDPIEHYNKYQIWVAIMIAFLSGVSPFLRYNEKDNSRFLKKPFRKILLYLVISTVLTVLMNLWLKISTVQHLVLLFASLFSIVCNLDVLIFSKVNRAKVLASFVSHAGFATMLIGIIASGLNQEHISVNRFMFSGILGEGKLETNINLIKEKPMYMSGYWVTYEKDTLIGQNRHFVINYKQIDENRNVIEEFTVRPNALYANDFSKIAAFNPDTKHYIHKDIFTRVSGLPAPQMSQESAMKMEDTLKYDLHTLPLNEWTKVNHYEVKVTNFNQDISHQEYQEEAGDIAFELQVSVRDTFGKEHNVYPAIALRNTVVYKYFEQVNDVKSRLRIHERTFENLVKADFQLEYQPKELQQGELFEIEGYSCKFESVEPLNKNFIPNFKEGDLGVKANLTATAPDGTTHKLQPRFVIRNQSIIPIRDAWLTEDLYVLFSRLNPETGSGVFNFAKGKRGANEVTLEIAKDVPRNDVISIETIVFPGINLFWLGTIAMMLGLGISLFIKRKKV